MRKFREISSFITIIALMVGVLFCPGMPARASSIYDPSDWAKKNIATAIEHGYVPYGLQYDYSKPITRQEFCELAVDFIQFATGQSIDALLKQKKLVRDEYTFKDTKDTNVLAAYSLGITHGTGNQKFSPDGQITREQAAAMIQNLCMAIGLEPDDMPDYEYSDIGKAASWSVDGINFCSAYGIMTGTGSAIHVFSPKGKYTREQSIVTMEKILESGAVEKAGYLSVPALPSTQACSAPEWADISSVQQFRYKDDGLAFAYEMAGKLMVVMPGSMISIEMKYPILGDVIADMEGNIYVVWGDVNSTSQTPVETTFVSKFLPNGQHVRTTGFVGRSSPWGDSSSAMTQRPFCFGNCVSVIANGILVNYHGKQRYDGHQSDQVIAVNIEDMSPYDVQANTYSGHSFNQSVIYCEQTKGYLFASQGDAYGRGFKINDINNHYGDAAGAYWEEYEGKPDLVFHFYLESNANYDMGIVNRTFAQLAGIVETSEGVALVGASAESIGEAAKTEKQNLFVKIVDPETNAPISSLASSCPVRIGASSFDINDNSKSPLTPVADYGVHWLTNYTDKEVVAPQIVKAGDRVVILWSTSTGDWSEEPDTEYMVLAADGSILTPVTSLNGIPLNSFEQPVFKDGVVYWASVANGRLKIRSVEIGD